MIYVLSRSKADAFAACARMEERKLILPGWHFHDGDVYVVSSVIRWSAVILQKAQILVDVLYGENGNVRDYYVMDELDMQAAFCATGTIYNMFHAIPTPSRDKCYFLFGFDADLPPGELVMSGYCLRKQKGGTAS